MIEEGVQAPDFSLPGIDDGDPEYYDLHRFVGEGHAAVLLFYPVDFVPAITPDLRAPSAAGWTDRDDLIVWAVSSDSLFAHAEYAASAGVGLPLLSDLHATIADAYDVVHEEPWRGHAGVPRRAVFVVDDDWTVRFGWAADDPLSTPRESPLVGAAEVLADLGRPVPRPEVDYPE